MRCIDCLEPATHRGRCAEHHQAYEGRASVRARRARQAVIARGNSAAARLRKRLRRAGRATCGRCGLDFLPSAVDVDHRTPLALGGEDVDSNVWPLCRPCHKAKTRTDFGASNPPF
ncbi:HNH endonuclease [Kitasatospora sp. NPDC098652]|uniref:HNH endonuclease n=1 Tax=Kitasatospora sp. NPDC098652 TaxID=3364095 RepID=UPI003820481F